MNKFFLWNKLPNSVYWWAVGWGWGAGDVAGDFPASIRLNIALGWDTHPVSHTGCVSTACDHPGQRDARLLGPRKGFFLPQG